MDSERQKGRQWVWKKGSDRGQKGRAIAGPRGPATLPSTLQQLPHPLLPLHLHTTTQPTSKSHLNVHNRHNDLWCRPLGERLLGEGGSRDRERTSVRCSLSISSWGWRLHVCAHSESPSYTCRIWFFTRFNLVSSALKVIKNRVSLK